MVAVALVGCSSNDAGESSGTGVGGGTGTSGTIARADASVDPLTAPDGSPVVVQGDAGPGTNDATTTTPKDGAVPSDSAGIPSPGTLGPAPAPPQDGWITVRLPGGHWHRIAAKVGATTEDLDVGLDLISSGTDEHVSPSADGQWLLVQSSRFGCTTGSCLSRFYWDLSAGEAIVAAGTKLTTGDGRAVISSGGHTIVYPAKNGAHPMELFVTKLQSNGAWSTPAAITTASPFSHHHDTAISADGSKVVFDCGMEPYGAPPTSLCEVKTDGTGFRTVVSPSDGPDNGSSHSIHHGDYAPDGSIVFEADWPGEQVWRLPTSGGPVRISPASQGNDNSPCVLEDGSIVSLWLGRTGGNGDHEIKVMTPSGSSSRMQLTGIDVVDVGMGCGH